MYRHDQFQTNGLKYVDSSNQNAAGSYCPVCEDWIEVPRILHDRSSQRAQAQMVVNENTSMYKAKAQVFRE